MRAHGWPKTLLVLGALVGAAPAFAGEEDKNAPPAPASADAGLAKTPEPRPPPVSKEDLEVVQNLELLENLDESRDLDLMQELTRL